MMKSIIKLSRYTLITAAVWVVSVLVLGGGYVLSYAPQQAMLLQVKNQCAESQMALESAQLAAQEKIKAKQQQQCEEAEQLIADFSARQDAVTELVFEIGRIATNELGLYDFSSKSQKQKAYPTVGKSKLVSEGWLKVDFEATFNQFAQFLNQLERHNPVVFVEEVAFQRGTHQTRGHKISLELSFLTQTEDKKVAAATH